MTTKNAAKPPDLDLLIAQLGEIYNEHRTTRRNFLYYEDSLRRAEKWSMTGELLLALGATGSPIVAWSIWQTNEGKIVWTIIAAVVSVIAIIKATIQPDKRIKRLVELHIGYKDIDLELTQLVYNINTQRRLTGETIKSFTKLRKQLKALQRREGLGPSRKLIEKYQTLTYKQIPNNSLWNPQKDPPK